MTTVKAATAKAGVEIVILSNGPGELVTWVRPVVQELQQQLLAQTIQARISVMLSPCPHATGKEVMLACSYPGVNRVQGAEHFWRFLLSGKTAENWQWWPQGVVLFLGGDQFYAVGVAKRLGYRSVVYAEWDARWWRWVDSFGVMQAEITTRIPAPYADKFTVVGDLMADARQGVPSVDLIPTLIQTAAETEWIGLLPGSKPAKLAQGVPLVLAIAEHLHRQRPQTQFLIPVAPTIDLPTLAKFADLKHNSIIPQMGGTTAELWETDQAYLQTDRGLKVQLLTQSPAYGALSQCRLCITTVGANTAELGSLAIPMVVLLPTQQLDAMRAWDGIPGLLANLPLLGSLFARLINSLVLRQGRRFAWPNIWAREEIVPELIGKLDPEEIANLVLNYLQYPEKLEAMAQRLQQVRGAPGAAQKLAELVIQACNLSP
ncbi:MAG: lipid-A-disaccharide synthase [Oscillatoriales cyanobacterium RM2_1_1]|nr:lipid-A-disaccharide synthase [Oscillatoriales cyanobacterium SM2_3_0]NJO47759.1 lipid-A-disaccharide synthase [Oscillatoriales cyanobacterium RM2_1_1]